MYSEKAKLPPTYFFNLFRLFGVVNGWMVQAVPRAKKQNNCSATFPVLETAQNTSYQKVIYFFKDQIK